VYIIIIYKLITFTNHESYPVQTFRKRWKTVSKPLPNRFLAVSFRFHVQARTISYKTISIPHTTSNSSTISRSKKQSFESFRNTHNLQLRRKYWGAHPLFFGRGLLVLQTILLFCAWLIVEYGHRAPQKWVKWLWGFGKKVLDFTFGGVCWCRDIRPLKAASLWWGWPIRSQCYGTLEIEGRLGRRLSVWISNWPTQDGAVMATAWTVFRGINTHKKNKTTKINNQPATHPPNNRPQKQSTNSKYKIHKTQQNNKTTKQRNKKVSK